MVKSAYIHIPFCKSRCHYCSFFSTINTELKQEYINSLLNEINFYYENEPLQTLYFGGGTPSLLGIKDFQKILKILNFSKNIELTIEINPDDAKYDYLKELYNLGINRLSFGCQTFDDEILKTINRRHSSEQIVKGYNNARQAGFENISFDFIYGLPNQTIEGFEKDLQKASELGVEHISLYGLSIEKGCYFYKNRPDIPNDDKQADMYLMAVDLLKNYGYKHYEISNFAKSKHYSKHNMNYWQCGEYYGFGAAAHGYKSSIRYSNPSDLHKYIQTPTQHEHEKFLTKNEMLEEEIFLGFRKMDGINVPMINEKFGINFEKKYRETLQKYQDLNLIIKTENGYKLSPNGVLVSNTILADFIE